MDKHYLYFKSNVKDFKKNLSWDKIAGQLISIYGSIIKDKTRISAVEIIRKNKSITYRILQPTIVN